MPSRRTWLKFIGCLVLLLASLGTFAYLSLSQLLEREHIEHFEWRGLGLSTQGIELEQLRVQHPHGTLQLQRVQLQWRRFALAPPFWQQINIAVLQLSLSPQPAPTGTASTTLDAQLEQLAAIINLLPQRLRVDALQIDLPCADTRCQLLGDLQLLKQVDPAAQLDIQLNLQHQQAYIAWHAQLQGDAQAAALELSLAVNRQPQLQLSSSLQPGAAGKIWQGEVTADLQQSEVLYNWLSQWLPGIADKLPGTPVATQLAVNWHLQLGTGPLDLASLQHASGRLQASARLPHAWPLPGIGKVQGDFNLSAHALDGQWLADSLSADLSLGEIPTNLINGLPTQLYPETLQLNIQATESPDNLAEQLAGRALPLHLQLRGQGRSPFSLHGTLALANGLPWGLQLLDGTLIASTPALQLDAWHVGALKAQLPISAYLDQQHLQVTLGKGATTECAASDYG